MTLLGLILILVGGLLGLLGDYPVGHAAHTSFELMVFGGLMLASGMVLLLLGSAGRGGRGDEPPGFIRP